MSDPNSSRGPLCVPRRHIASSHDHHRPTFHHHRAVATAAVVRPPASDPRGVRCACGALAVLGALARERRRGRDRRRRPRDRTRPKGVACHPHHDGASRCNGSRSWSGEATTAGARGATRSTGSFRTATLSPSRAGARRPSAHGSQPARPAATARAGPGSAPSAQAPPGSIPGGPCGIGRRRPRALAVIAYVWAPEGTRQFIRCRWWPEAQRASLQNRLSRAGREPREGAVARRRCRERPSPR